ncbi:hypothetical protein COMNV_00832 [Commensalibacter sp. Nvir]|uniref:L,D-transpeptidase n=1 Tax=Commensalibacter sp. Nvir TaxID=3069817 RepID=UPI002D67BAE8|nr:hypothetical protein COMNV_00832 [Commensalibacter sp. Nvir]
MKPKLLIVMALSNFLFFTSQLLAASSTETIFQIPLNSFDPFLLQKKIDGAYDLKNQSYFDYNLYHKSSLFHKRMEEVNLPPLPNLSYEDALKEAKKLIIVLKSFVRNGLTYNTLQKRRWISLANYELEKNGFHLERTQILTVVDRNPKIQNLCFILAFPKYKGDWIVLGGDKISTGSSYRKLYYITPTGVFVNSIDRFGYRALGTKNKFGIKGNGIKGMRVWDFGWQWAQKSWLSNQKGQIRLEMHATDPVYLEHRLGHPASEGCIRISAGMNRFIDQYGLIDALFTQAAQKNKRYGAIFLKGKKRSPLAGQFLIVVDSSEKQNKT